MRLFEEARSLPAAEREAFVRQVGGPDVELVREVCALLEADSNKSDLLGDSDIDRSSRVGLDLVDAVLSDSDATRIDYRGKTIGRYVVGSEVARGGMGVVYKATDPDLERTVALKVVVSGVLASQGELARLRNEALAVARLDHPNIVSVFDIGEHEGRPFIAMPFLEGGDLSNRANDYREDPARIAGLMETIARAVHFAHGRGVLHRDLKPANILFDRQGRPFVTDFGLARLTDQQSLALTREGSIVGTLAYMPPEQANGERPAESTIDVYSLGVVLYELLTGRPPFRGAASGKLLHQILNEDPVSPSRIDSWVPRDLETICLRCLRKSPRSRYPTAGALADDLGRFRRGEPIEARPTGRLERAWLWSRRHPARATLVLLVALLAVAVPTVAAWYLADMDRRERELVHRERRTYALSLDHAYDLWGTGRTKKALEVLERLEPAHGAIDFRGFGWHHLHRLTRARRPGIARTVGDWGTSLLRYLGPHGDRLLHSTADVFYAEWTLMPRGQGLRKVIRPRSKLRKPRQRLVGDERILRFVSIDGRRRLQLVKLEADPSSPVGTRVLRDVDATSLTGLGVSPDGARVFAGSTAPQPKLLCWDVETWALRQVPTTHALAIEDIVVAGGNIVSLSPGIMVVHDAESLAETRRLETVYGGEDMWAKSRSGELLALMDTLGRLQLWDLRDGTRRLELSTSSGTVHAIEFSRDDALLAISKTSWAGNEVDSSVVELWDVREGRRLRVLRPETFYVAAMDFSPDGRTLAMANDRGNTDFYDLAFAHEPPSFRPVAGAYVEVAFEPSGRHFVAVNNAGALERFECIESGPTFELRRTAVAQLDELDDSIHALSPRGDALVTLAGDGALRIVRVDWTDSPPRIAGERFDGGEPRSGVVAAYYGDDPDSFSSAHADGRVVRWTRRDSTWRAGETVTLQPIERGLLAVSPDAAWFARSDGKGEMTVRHIPSGAQASVAPWPEAPLDCLVFSPSSNHLLAGIRAVKVFDLASVRNGGQPELRSELEGSRWRTLALRFLPGGELLAAACADGTIKLWDFVTAEERATLEKHRAHALGLAVSPDGKRILSCGGIRKKRGDLLLWIGQ